MTIRVTLQLDRCAVCNHPYQHHQTAHAYVPSQRRLVQNFPGCASLEEGARKAKAIFPEGRVLKTEAVSLTL